MRLSNKLAQDHNSGDFGMALEGYCARARRLEDALEATNLYLKGECLPKKDELINIINKTLSE